MKKCIAVIVMGLFPILTMKLKLILGSLGCYAKEEMFDFDDIWPKPGSIVEILLEGEKKYQLAIFNATTGFFNPTKRGGKTEIPKEEVIDWRSLQNISKFSFGFWAKR